MENETQLLVSLGYLLFMIGLAWIFKTYPPREINPLYGYRTKRSMANLDVWNAANAHWTRLFFRWQWFLLAVPLVLYTTIPSYCLMGTVVIHTLVLLCTIPATEHYLNQHFDKHGNPK